MLQVFVVLLSSFGIGALLASDWIDWPLRPGYIGALLLVGAALAARAHWERRARLAGDDPGAAEREVWQSLAGTALICGFVLVVLLTPGSEVHLHTGDTGGRDSWTMLAGAFVSWLIVRNPATRRDERDLAIAAHGLKVGYCSLVLMLVVLLLNLGFAPPPLLARMTHWLLANTLLLLLMLSSLAYSTAQLLAYWREARSDAAEALAAAPRLP